MEKGEREKKNLTELLLADTTLFLRERERERRAGEFLYILYHGRVRLEREHLL